MINYPRIYNDFFSECDFFLPLEKRHSCAIVSTSIQVPLSPPYAVAVARTRTVNAVGTLRIAGARDPPTPAHAGSTTHARAYGKASTLAARRDAADRQALRAAPGRRPRAQRARRAGYILGRGEPARAVRGGQGVL